MKRPLKRPRWIPRWLPPLAAAAAAAALVAACGSTSTSSTSPGSTASGTSSASATATAPIRTTTPATSKPTVDSAALIAAATNDYQFRAATAKANYYKEARNPDAALSTAAKQRLTNWFTGSARQAIISQVNSWDRNYSLNIDVVAALVVLHGQVQPNGTIKLRTLETWSVTTEGGPVLNQDGTSTTQETHVYHTVLLKYFANGWAVTSTT